MANTTLAVLVDHISQASQNTSLSDRMINRGYKSRRVTWQ